MSFEILRLEDKSFNTEIEKELEALKNYSIDPKFGFGIGSSVVINKKCYMLKHIPYSNTATIETPMLKHHKDDLYYYSFNDVVSKRVINFKDFDELLKKIDSYLVSKDGSKTDNKGNIYLVSDGKYTKIGATTYNVEKRLVELQTGNAQKLSIIGYYEVDNKLSTEKHLHSIFSYKNILNEWFDLKQTDINEILSSKINIKRESKFQSFDVEDIVNIRNALYSNYSDYDAIKIKKISRLDKKIKELKEKLNIYGVIR